MTSNARRRERVLASPQFDGRIFVNPNPVSAGFKPGVERPTVGEFLCGGERRVPAGPLPIVDPAPVWSRPPETGLRVTWLGHSTLLIEIDGVRILTDPVWSERASPLPFAGPKRFHPPPAPLRSLPPLDVVLLSHDHYDHLDRSTVRTLAKTGVRFLASLGVGERLEKWGLPPERVSELDWWETAEVRGVAVAAAPAQHFSGRGIRDRNGTLWSSFHLRGAGHSFFYGADSGLMPQFTEIGQRLGPFDVTALEIGAYHPSWGDIHMGPDNALVARQRLGSGLFLPIHWGTFNLAMHPWDQPAEVILEGAPAAGLPLAMPRPGAPVEPARVETVTPWWRAVGGMPVTATSDGRDEATPLEWAPD